MSDHMQELARIKSDLNDLRASQVARGQSMNSSSSVAQQMNQRANISRINNDLRALRGSALSRNDNASAVVDLMASQMINQVRTMN